MMKLWLCAAAAATANYAEHSAERLQTQRDKCPWTAAIKHTGGGDEIAYERAPTGLADIFSSMLTAFWYATLARRPLAILFRSVSLSGRAPPIASISPKIS